MCCVGKIARLPRDVRDQLNRRLENGEGGASLVAWLNSLPGVKKALKRNGEWWAVWLNRVKVLADGQVLADCQGVKVLADGQRVKPLVKLYQNQSNPPAFSALTTVLHSRVRPSHTALHRFTPRKPNQAILGVAIRNANGEGGSEFRSSRVKSKLVRCGQVRSGAEWFADGAEVFQFLSLLTFVLNWPQT